MQGLVKRVTIKDIAEMAAKASETLANVRSAMLDPHPRKAPPKFTTAQIAAFCAMEKEKLDYHLGRSPDLPVGTIATGKRRRVFSLVEARQIVKALTKRERRPDDFKGATIACVNFKGGSTKTTTAFNLAQGLTLLGRDVLLIDLDAQASASTLTGLLPSVEIAEEDTAGLLTLMPRSDAPKSLKYAVRETYWSGLDLVPAAPSLYSSEMLLPVIAHTTTEKWWAIIDEALAPLRQSYDYIIFDTAPALSYLAINAILASDGLIMPLPPETLDYASSVAFWEFATETFEKLQQNKRLKKDFSFLHVLVSKATSRPAAMIVKDFIAESYGQYVMPCEIPASESSSLGGLQFGTAYDLKDDDGVSRTNTKLREAFDRFVEMIDSRTVATGWGGAK